MNPCGADGVGCDEISSRDVGIALDEERFIKAPGSPSSALQIR